MRIACLGWGSLVWDPQDLPVQRHWFNDGPVLPIEFARRSSRNRLTLVIVPGARPVRSLWTIMTVDDLDSAKVALAKREGIHPEGMSANVGWWIASQELKADEVSAEIGRWAAHIGLDAVIWTALSPGLHPGRAETPTSDAVIAFLQGLPSEQRQDAEEYIRKAPHQIDTDNRRRIEAEFGWAPIDSP